MLLNEFQTSHEMNQQPGHLSRGLRNQPLGLQAPGNADTGCAERLAPLRARHRLSQDEGGATLAFRLHGGFPKIRGTFSGGPHIQDSSILGSILGSPYLGKLPHAVAHPLQRGAGRFAVPSPELELAFHKVH